MYRLFRFCLPTIALLATLLPLQAQAFLLSRIDIRGLHGISRDTVLSYLPVRTGQTFNPEQMLATIQKVMPD